MEGEKSPETPYDGSDGTEIQPENEGSNLGSLDDKAKREMYRAALNLSEQLKNSGSMRAAPDNPEPGPDIYIN